MAQQDKTTFEGTFNNSSTGLFKTNTTKDIGSDDLRTLVDNLTDSVPFNQDDRYTWSFPQVSTTGTNTYAATPSPVITAYSTGQAFKIKFTEASTGASTLNLNGVGAKKLFTDPATQATTGDIVDEQVYLLIYDAALDAAAGGFLMIGGSGGGSVVAASESASGIAELATQAETNTGTDDARIVTPLKLNTKLRATRTVTGADAAVQSDDNSIIYLNSATPFNFTLDQLTATSRISFVNIGAGAVTLIAGSGVTITGSVVISGAVGTNYPSAFVFYHTATTPRVSMGGTNGLASVSADTSGATITLNFNAERERIFVGSASFGTAKAVTLSNESNGLVMILFLNLTNVAAVLSFDTDFTMMASDARWNDGAHTFTPQTTGLHKFSAVFNGTDWVMEASNPYYG